MTRNANPFAQLKELHKGYPTEPFRDRPRRPNGYRDKPEYRQWQQLTREQDRRIAQWYEDHLLLTAPGPGQLRLELAGRPVPGYHCQVQPDGSVQLDREYGRIMYPDLTPEQLPPGWTRPLEIPTPDQDVDRFMSSNRSRSDGHRRWELHPQVAHAAPPSVLITHYNQLPGLQLRDVRNHIDEVMADFVGQVSRILDPQAFRLLNRVNGSPPGQPWTLLDYNMAVLGREALLQAAAANPGAAAWWLDDWHEKLSQTQVYFPPQTPQEQRLPSPPPARIPSHPAEIIRPVRERFNADGGQGWKAFARQPAGHIHRQLHRRRDSRSGLHTDGSNWQFLLWLNARLHEANLAGIRNRPVNGQRPTPAPQEPAEPAAPDPAIPLLHLSLLAEAPAPAATSTRNNEPRAGRTQPPEPPLFLKLLLSELRFARSAPGARRNQDRHRLGMPDEGPMGRGGDLDPDQAAAALDHLATLVLRQFAQLAELKPKTWEHRQLKSQLQDLADYCWAEPAAARQAATYRGLEKASHRWHQDHQLRQIAAELAAQREADATPWDLSCPLPAYQDQNWQANYLTCPADLLQESTIMNHCVGGQRYQQECRYGHSRIYHLQPQPRRAPADWKPNELAKRNHGSTVQLVNMSIAGDQGSERWMPSQHRGFMNRLPTPEEEAFAIRLADALNRAEAAQRDTAASNAAA